MLCEDVEIGAETYNNMKTESQIKDFTSIRGISAHLKKLCYNIAINQNGVKNMKPVQNANEWENFCHNMVLLRQTHGYSLLRMAFVLRISPVKLRAVERGEWMPKWDIRILFRIRKKFGVQASELFADRLDR